MTQSVTHHPKVELSTYQIIFKPSDSSDFSRAAESEAPDLTVTVTNTTSSFISFHLELHAEEHQTPSQSTWYEVKPNVCAKKPPGDRTQFHIKLLKAPIPAYDTTIPLQVKVFSAELASLSATETVYLKILRPTKTLRVFLPFQDLSIYPGARLKIPVLTYNLNAQMRNVTLRLDGVKPDWFPEGIEQTVWVEAGSSVEAEFWCAPPAIPSTLHEVHHLNVQATDDQGNSASADGHFYVLPFGRLHHQVDETEKIIPDQLTPLSLTKKISVSYNWTLANESNVSQTIDLTTNADRSMSGIQCFAEPTTLEPDAKKQTPFQVKARQPWLGWTRTHFIEVIPTLQYPESQEPIPEIAATPASHLLTLNVKPRIPLILQLLILIASGLAMWGLWFLSPKPLHRGPINTVRIMGNSDLVVSASSDRTFRQWQVNRASWLPDIRRLSAQDGTEEPTHRFDKAIRVAELMPANFRQVAVGLENGEIQLWEVDPPAYIETLLEDGAFDRVFDLAFTHDSRYLFSGHGSGTVRVWGRRQGQWQPQPEEKLHWGLPGDLSFAIASLAVSSDDELVAVAGQFNRLMLWDWRSPQGATAYDIPYDYLSSALAGETTAAPSIKPVISSNSYLTSVDFASENPNIMVTADNLGFITVWDMQQLRACMPTARDNPHASEDAHENSLQIIRRIDCPLVQTILAQWQAGEQGSAIRDIALDKTGCFLASTGDGGQISVWPLTPQGSLAEPPSQARITVEAFPNQPLNSVDIHRTQDNVLLIAADTPGYRVQLYRTQLSNHGCQ